jgi:hypothetical protein
MSENVKRKVWVEKDDRETIYSDPTMVMASFSRIQSGKSKRLFGSSVRHNTMISLEIHHAKMVRRNSRDWYHREGSPIIELMFSPSQFAELITSMNIGDGVPATLVQMEGNQFLLPEYPTKSEQFRDEINEDLKNTASSLKALEDEIHALIDDPKPIGKGKRQELAGKVQSLRKLVDDYLPFIMESFGKQMEETVVEAKQEVEAFVENMVINTGIAALKNNAPMLEEKMEETSEET